MLDDSATKDFVWLRSGTKRRQLARIVRYTDGCVVVQKFRANGGKWTKPIWTLSYHILGPLTPEEQYSHIALAAIAAFDAT